MDKPRPDVYTSICAGGDPFHNACRWRSFEGSGWGSELRVCVVDMSMTQVSSAGSGVSEGAAEPVTQDRVLGAEVLDLDASSVEASAQRRVRRVALRAAVGSWRRGRVVGAQRRAGHPYEDSRYVPLRDGERRRDGEIADHAPY